MSVRLRAYFGELVRTRRGLRGISQEELAGRAGLHRTYLSDIERGARNPSLESIDKIAKALGVPLAMLFTQLPPPQHESTDGPVESASACLDILLVEDNPRDVALTLRAFERARLANPVSVVQDGAEALDYLFCTGAYAWRAGEPLPGVLLLDLNLPKVDGLEVLRRVKRDERTAAIPVVVLTASARERDALACRQSGADAYLVKPVNFAALSEVAPKLSFSWTLTQVKPAPSDG
ncbi:MAG TPA: response regulator [Kiritimatiellia bacterium]|nr:response regulator [Kiritimatiellia bacterium]